MDVTDEWGVWVFLYSRMRSRYASHFAVRPTLYADTEAFLWRGLWEGMEAGGCNDPRPAWSHKFPPLFGRGGVLFVWSDNWHERRKQLTGHSTQAGFVTVLLRMMKIFGEINLNHWKLYPIGEDSNYFIATYFHKIPYKILNSFP